MDLVERKDNEVLILTLKGRLDAATVKAFLPLVVQRLDQGERRLLFDFSELEYINSSGLGILIMAYQKLEASGGKMAISGIKEYIQEVFDATGYSRLLSLHADLGEAMAFLTE